MEILFRQNLLQWFKENARQLPWRIEPNLYKTVVSEFMLQQTQVKTVLPYFTHNIYYTKIQLLCQVFLNFTGQMFDCFILRYQIGV